MVFDRVVFGTIWPSGSKILVFDRVVQKFRYLTEWFRYLTEWFRYVTDKIISTALVITSSRETTSGRWPHLIQGQRWICVRPGLGLGLGRGILSRNKHFRTTRSNTNHSVKYRDFRTTRSNTGIFEPLGQIPKTARSNHGWTRRRAKQTDFVWATLLETRNCLVRK